MADKVLRFTAEDSGYGQTIDRMAGKLRSAFSNTGMSDILQEADSKFTKFGDKVKYIQSQLSELKGLNEQERKEAVGSATAENMRTGYKRSNDAVQKEVSREYEKEEKSIDRLIQALDRFGEKVEDASEKGEGGGGVAPIPIIGGGGRGGGKSGGGGGGGFMENAFAIAAGFGIEKLGEKLLGFLVNEARSGIDLARQENTLNRQFQLPDDLLSDAGGRTKAPYELGVNNKKFLESLGQTASSRRSANDVVDETINRLRLTSAYGVTQEQFGGLDRFYRKRQFEGGDMLDRSQFDAGRTIVEILSRADRAGILGVSKNDFTMLPEKIGQVTGLMAQQYAQGDRTDANTAINLILAGQKIGGRFADDRAADTFGKISSGIANPNGTGSKAFMIEALRRANPGMSPLELEAQMQNGLSESNIKTIFPAIQNVRSHEMRGRIFQQVFGLDAQSALRMANSESIPAMMKQLGEHGLDKAGLGTAQTGIQKRAEDLTLTLDKWGTYFSNSVTSFGEAVTKFVNGVGTKPVTAEDMKLHAIIGPAPHTVNTKVMPKLIGN